MMNRLRRLIALLLSVNLFVTPLVRASFDDIGVGGRGPGMADVQVGVADDANATVYNPAGLVHTKSGQLTSEYGQFMKGLDDGSSVGSTYLGYAQPLRSGDKGVLGLAYHNFKAANLLTERTLTLAYGWKLKTEPFGWRGKWSLGGALKQLHRQYEPDRFTENALNDAGTGTGQTDPLFGKNGYASDAYALDLGAHYQFGERDKYSAGLVLRNANQPDVSLGGDGDKAPLSIKLGMAYHAAWGLISGELRRVNRLAGSSDTETALGAERRFSLKEENAFVLRGGYASGSRNYRAVTAGASYILGNAEFDYAFNFPVGALSSTNGSHRVGFSYKVGAVKEKEETAPEPVATPTPVVAPAQPVETPQSTPDDVRKMSPLPEAPQALTAPVPVLKSTEPAVVNPMDDSIKSFGALLGYYVSRTNAGAPVEERRAILKELKRLFGSSGIDMTYVNDELKSIGEEPVTVKPAVSTPKPVLTLPVAKPIMEKPAKAQPKTAPAPAANAEMERAWQYYRQAVERGITDSERIEILENILLRFGESTADKVVKELEKVRKRLE